LIPFEKSRESVKNPKQLFNSSLLPIKIRHVLKVQTSAIGQVFLNHLRDKALRGKLFYGIEIKALLVFACQK